MTLNCIIVDDEAFARRHLEKLLGGIEGVNLIDSFSCSADVLTFARQNGDNIHILFLDIEMKDMDGMELAGRLRQETSMDHIQIVFTTGHAQFALKSYRLDATDFLLKPVLENEFNEALLRCRKRALAQEFIQKHLDSTILVKNVRTGRKTNVRRDDILYVESMDHYTKIHTAEVYYLILLPLKKTFSLLGTPNFVQIHRGIIINVDKIANYDYKKIALHNGVVLDIGQTFQKTIHKLLNRKDGGLFPK
ncbi:response regulator transcription factor [Sphingobacterium alkalisoli]|uniref:Response regulator transcription factor n=1 Tax=Sphingobacterium alkalisoli TaxID=1874115 RepID=A0A4U0GXE1_9SPHI|nr:LytTR family DNA-binding domain-containing protein [Sphingobacterium alkalisoli]TJY63728.1 response regulator transcription factor [Sphingobacterium alkalisoli]GGH25262.1 DNA-binding response regulator [Sphingobacterium alkalisoli]